MIYYSVLYYLPSGCRVFSTGLIPAEICLRCPTYPKFYPHSALEAHYRWHEIMDKIGAGILEMTPVGLKRVGTWRRGRGKDIKINGKKRIYLLERL